MVPFDDYFRLPKFLMSIIPLNPLAQYHVRTGGVRRALLIAFYFFTLASLLFICGGKTVFLVDIIKKKALITDIAGCAGWLIMGTMSIDALWMLYYNRDNIISVIKQLEALFPKTLPEQTGARVHFQLFKWNRLIMIFLRFYTGTFLTASLTTIVYALVGYYTEGVWHYDLPMFITYPFNPYRMPLVVVLFVFESWAVMLTTIPLASMGLMLGSITRLLSLQYQILGTDLNNMVPQQDAYARDVAELGHLVRRHNRLLDLSVEIRQLFSLTLLINYLFSSVVICLFTFTVANATKMQEGYKGYIDSFGLGCCICAFLLYNALYSYYGNQLIEKVRIRVVVCCNFDMIYGFPSESTVMQSLSLATCMYNSDWFEADIRYKKLMILIMMRSSTPEKYMGMGFFVVSFESQAKV